MDEPVFWSAAELVAALRARELGSRELLEHYLRRAGADPVNAVVTLDAERARAEAAAADEAAARGESLGPLHGLPVTVKDAIETAGLRTTCGAPELAAHVPERDATAVARLRAAGAVVFGKTNTPRYAADAQTFNEVFGTTANPWDPARSPGGSSGGAAAAVAAGLTGLELGSDLGGSIRIPAGYCGVFGLRPSAGCIPVRGHIPPAPHGRAPVPLGTLGPIARSAADLGLALSVLAGPDAADATAWRLALPPPRSDRLAGYRIAVWPDDPACPVGAEVREVFERAVAELRAAGATLDVVAAPVDLRASVRLFQRLVQPAMATGIPDEEFAGLAATADGADGEHGNWVRDMTAPARDVLLAEAEAVVLRERWADFFREHDALLCPVTPTPALPHDPSPDPRWITVDGQRRNYWSQVVWSQALSVAQLPVAGVPLGTGTSGLPVGAQLVGPYLEDRTVVDVAVRLAEVLGGYRRPPGY